MMTHPEMEQADMQHACRTVLADLGSPVGGYVEAIHKETFVASGHFPYDYWRLVVIVPGLPCLVVQFPAANLPCEACGVLYPASTLSYGACKTCWSMMPYTLPLSM
jgi:hypothetical protein